MGLQTTAGAKNTLWQGVSESVQHCIFYRLGLLHHAAVGSFGMLNMFVRL